MSTDVIWQTECSSLKATLQLAEHLGARLRGGEMIELVSDLGGGKTTFVRGLVKGMGGPDQVSSPTFTLSNTYQAPGLTMHHFDFYRLHEPGIMRDELVEILDDPQAVTVIEWADIVQDVLPAERITIHFSATGDTSRHIACKANKQFAYMFEGVI